MPSKDWLIKQYQGVSAITRTEDNTGGIADAAIA
jgi:hypothetical protein